MMKYELSNETITIGNGKTLFRIRAIVDIAEFGVKIGDLGGYIEKEDNLSHNGNTWVFGDAYVFGNARVCDNAKVSGNAWVYDDAEVSCNAWVFGDAYVFGNAWVFDDARVYSDAKICGDAEINKKVHVLTIGPIGSRNGTTTFFRTEENIIKVTCGCFYGTIDKFIAKVELTHGNNKNGRAYRIAAELAKTQIELE